MARTEGRMINKDISESDGFALLSPPAAVLFCMLIPHLNSHGKMNGGPAYLKEIICPKVEYLDIETIKKCLGEITKNTNVKWFEYDKRHWIHSINFLSNHQRLSKDKLGRDLLPSYSGVTPELGVHEVEVEVEEKEKGTPALAGHSWETFRSLMPLRHGKFLDEDSVRDKWIRNPGMWNQWLAAVRNYAASSEVKDGAVCSPMTFLTKKWRDFETPEEPIGAQTTAREPDYSWREEREEDEMENETFRREVQSGAVAARPRDRLPHESEEEYERKKQEGRLPMVKA